MGSFVLRKLRHFAGIASQCRYRKPCIIRRGLSTDPRPWSTPLATQLSKAITATGPIPLATYMRMCLTSDQGGYYTTKQEGRDQLGRKGDFVTSPEISQIFGELIGIWFVTVWIAQGRSTKGVELLEMGPGRGTLMDDMLRTMANFKSMASSIEAIYLVETSPSLRDIQKKLLCGDAPMTTTAIGYQSTSKYANIPVMWTENIKFVPKSTETSPFIVAHEFFDALPIHAFQTVESPAASKGSIQTPRGEHKLAENGETKYPVKQHQWREMVITPNQSLPLTQRSSEKSPEFELSLSKFSTPHSLFLPELSARYKALKSTPGALIEISPESQTYAQEFARRIGGTNETPKVPSGAALILDYGTLDTIPTNSLRGVHKHQRVSPLSSPGLVDISADVDFTALAQAALGASSGVEVHGPVDQSFFLHCMGIKERAETLMKALGADESRKQAVADACSRLIDRGQNGMGKVYKAMAIVPERGGKSRPVGFGGEIPA